MPEIQRQNGVSGDHAVLIVIQIPEPEKKQNLAVCGTRILI